MELITGIWIQKMPTFDRLRKKSKKTASHMKELFRTKLKFEISIHYLSTVQDDFRNSPHERGHFPTSDLYDQCH